MQIQGSGELAKPRKSFKNNAFLAIRRSWFTSSRGAVLERTPSHNPYPAIRLKHTTRLTNRAQRRTMTRQPVGRRHAEYTCCSRRRTCLSPANGVLHNPRPFRLQLRAKFARPTGPRGQVERRQPLGRRSGPHLSASCEARPNWRPRPEVYNATTESDFLRGAYRTTTALWGSTRTGNIRYSQARLHLVFRAIAGR